MSNTPIGVFDSGVGGLSVLSEIHQQLPQESLIYIADSGYAPYGHRSCDYIRARCHYLVNVLLAQGAKAIVIACNTATSVAVDELRRWCPVPIIAMEPAIKPARLCTKTGKVAVLATQQTLCSDKVHQLIATHGHDIQVVRQACAGFVELVESGAWQAPATYQLVEQYVQPLVQQGVDTLVLGCTHYPFLCPVIQQAAGEQIRIIDPSAAIARQLQRRLVELGKLSTSNQLGSISFFTTGDVAQVQNIICQLWKDPVCVRALTPSKAVDECYVVSSA